MTHRINRNATLLAAAILAAYATVADAADTRPADATTTRAERAVTGNGTATNGAAAVKAPVAAQPIRDIRMSDLIGMDVRNARGENLGDIKDLVVDTDSGRVQYAVVGIGGFLGIGEKLSAFPMSAFKIAQNVTRTGTASGDRVMDNDGVKGDKGPIGSDRTPAERAAQGRAGVVDNDGVKGDKGPIGSDRTTTPADRTAATAPATTTGSMLGGRGNAGMHMVLNADPQRMKKAPNFDKDQWPDWNDSKYRGEVDRAAGVTTPAGKGARLVRASTLMDADIRDAQSKNVGEIEDLVVDVRSGQVHYAVIDFDRAWTPDDKLVAVPMKALRPMGAKGELVFNGDRSRIERAPAFDKGKWPDLNGGTYRSNVDRYLSSWGGTTTTPGATMSGTPTDRTRATTAGTAGTTGTTGTTGNAPAGTAGSSGTSR
jgi:sporulation protein YlmC with PRC-barrel domain